MRDPALASNVDARSFDEPEPPLDPRVHDRRWLILGVLCMSLLIIVMDNTILNVAIPSMMEELGATNSQIQWIIDSYVLVFAGLLLTTGSISDRFGRKGALQAGIVLFGLGSVLAANATTATQLIAFRAFMGIGGALIMPATLSILTNVFRDPKERGRAIGVWAGFSGLGIAIGPITGGFLLEHFDWSSVFWVNLPIGALALGLGAFLVPTSRDPKQTKLDPVGALLSIVGLAALLFGIIEGQPKGWGSAEVLTGFAVAIVALGGFVTWELHSDHPMLDLSVFRNARFSAASGTITIVFFGLMGSLFLMTQYWQLVHGYSPLDAGVRLLPAAVVMMLAAPQSARLVERFGTKRVVLAGLGLIATGMLLTSFIETDTPYWNVMGRFLVMYLGMSLTMAPATESVMGALPRDKAGVGSAINDTTRQVGGALGVAIIGSVVSGHWASGIAKTARAAGLDEAATANSEESLARAMSEAGALGDGAGAFIAQAKDTFVDAMTMGMRVSFVIVLVAAFVAWKFLPNRAGRHRTVGPAATAAAAEAFEELSVAAGE